jgi:hypothetical protein
VSARRRGPFPLKTPLFDLGKVTITKRAKKRLEKEGIDVHAFLDCFHRMDWPDATADEFGEAMADLREGNPFSVSWDFGARMETQKHVTVFYTPGKSTSIETGYETLHRMQPKEYGPEGEWPKKVWGKGVYTEPPAEMVKAVEGAR